MTFQRAFDFLMSVECPPTGDCYSDHPTDPGGATKYGMTNSEFQYWLRSKSLPEKHVLDATKADAEAFYRRIWEDEAVQACLVHVSNPMAIILFDAMVNQGPVTAVKILQRAINAILDTFDWLHEGPIAEDGDFGPATDSVLATLGSELVDEYIEQEMLWQRLDHYWRIAKSWRRQKKVIAVADWFPVWVNRMFRLYREVTP